MKRTIFLIIVGSFTTLAGIRAQPLGDLCTNPYTVTLQDPSVAACDYAEITGLDFTNFGDHTFTPAPSCDYGTNNNDIWVKLTVPTNADGFKITMDSSVITSVDNDYQNFKVAVYTGSSCGSLVYKTCKSSSRARVYNNYFDGFTAGDPVYLRIYTDNSPSGTWDKPFFVRITPISTNRSNDACSFASALIPGNYCNHLATDKGENDDKAPDKLTSTTSVCAPGNAEFGSFDNNQWYYFEVTPSTPQPVRVTISNVNCSAGDKILQVAIWKANAQNCSSWGNGYDLNSPSAASEGDLLACAVGTGSITLSENLPVGKYWYTVDGSAGSFCEYAITEAPVFSVPIRLLRFYSTSSDPLQLHWLCMDVTTFSSFVIEKSSDGKFFTEDRVIVEYENKTGPSHYTYAISKDDFAYYRIKIEEPGERPYYSEIISVGNNGAQKKILSTFYSRSEGLRLFLNTNKEISLTEISMTDLAGRELWSQKEKELMPGENNFTGLGKEFPTGIYFVNVLMEGEYYRFKLFSE